MTSTHHSSPDHREATLYCRASTATASAIDRYHRELSRLSSTGILDEVSVVTWPSRVELGAATESEVARAYESFTEWATEEGRRLAPAFDVESYESAFTGESGTALVTPVACVAVEDDGELTAVYPHVEDGDVVTVEDGIERLATLDGESVDAPADERAAGTQD